MSTDVMTPLPTDSRPPRRRRLLLIAIAALVVVGLGLGLGLGLTGSSKPTEVQSSKSTASGQQHGKAKPAQDPNTLVFKDVAADKANRLEGTLVRVHGVKGVTYYPKTHMLDVMMNGKTATDADKAKVRSMVTKS